MVTQKILLGFRHFIAKNTPGILTHTLKIALEQGLLFDRLSYK